MTTNDDRYIELFKLQKLFECSFSVGIDQKTDAIGDIYNNKTVNITILLRPTDPEFDLSLLSPIDGIRLVICLHSGNTVSIHSLDGQENAINLHKYVSSRVEDGLRALSLAESTNSEGKTMYYEVKEIEDIKVENEGLSNAAKKIIQRVLFDYISKNLRVRKYVIYESLKFLDKNLVQLFSIAKSLQKQQSNTSEESQNAAATSTHSDGSKEPESVKEVKLETPWTLEEQKCLEDGLVKAKGITDLRQKWLLISKIVKTRTPDQCRKRFIRCRELLLKKNETVSQPEPQREEPALDRTAPLALLGLDMKKVSLAKIGTFILELACVRCASHFEANFIDNGEKTILYNKNCNKCNIIHRCEFVTSLIFPSQPIMGRLSLINTNFKDFNNGEFALTCEDCDTQCKIRDIKIGTKKSLNCRGCFAKFQFSFEGIEFGERETVDERVVKRVIRHETKKTVAQAKGVKVGTPLPDNGTCKHYKKSFRWFRFPCCGRLFPCDVCHDEVSNHKCDHANFIVCGYCSTQQPSFNKVCKFCSKGCTASSSSHWEGGKGCRDPSKLSKKDSKKYKLASKQTIKDKPKK